jgi:uncharacterized protein
VLRDLYYQFKPCVPWRWRLRLRRHRARRHRARFARTWPINEAAAQPPLGWQGWPNGKQFAFVLTHDVEGNAGLQGIEPLLKLESELGFRSSINFVPEGSYEVSRELRAHLSARGVEVGVHDLRHDGKLYRSRSGFRRRALRINRYLREWNAVGFRSAFMLHEIKWLHELDILYDASTFDTDPFEPQPDGVHTIYPFWVPGPGNRGYIELPYTLPQDSTLFVVLEERSPALWERKLDWIAEHGGMALLDTHPDYMDFTGNRREGSYPVAFYREFLQTVARKYGGRFWHALPREVAVHMSGGAKQGVELVPREVRGGSRSQATMRRKIWIDLDNTPHVPFFRPIITELQARGYEVLVSARDAFQVCALADFHGVAYRKIGRHYGKNKLIKVLGLFYRASQLLPLAIRERPALGLSHGSRSQIIACRLLGIPTVLVADYEHAKTPPLMRPKWELAPQAIPSNVLHCRNGHVRKYSGIKEDVYAWMLVPDDEVLRNLDISAERIIAVVRPPATEAHYHNPESELLFARAMERLCARPDVQVVLLPRNRRQEDWIRTRWPAWFRDGRVSIPTGAVDGLNLIWHADFVISGGGTMNRESAALGVPVYSIFRGPTGAVDRHLAAEGRLILVTSVDEVQSKILIRKRDKSDLPDSKPGPALRDIVGHVEAIFDIETPSNPDREQTA